MDRAHGAGGVWGWQASACALELVVTLSDVLAAVSVTRHPLGKLLWPPGLMTPWGMLVFGAA